MSFDTITDILTERAKLSPSTDGFASKDPQGNYRFMTWGDFAREVRLAASGLRQSGVTKGDRIGILMPTCLNWERVHYAALACGVVVVGLDLHETPEKLDYVLNHAAINILAINDSRALEKIPQTYLEKIKQIVSFGDSCEKIPDERLMLWDNLVACGREDNKTSQAPLPTDAATIIYTSGTTKEPKAIRYSQGQIALACNAILQALPEISAGTRTVCWLPLSNLFQRMINLCAIQAGGVIHFVENPLTVTEELPVIKPEIFSAIPRFYEKLYAGLRATIQKQPPLAQTAFTAALTVCKKRMETIRTGSIWKWVWNTLFWPADHYVMAKIRKRLGADQIRFMISGSAPIAKTLLEFFEALGLPILEAYGLSENIIPVAMNRPGRYRLGSVGLPLLSDTLKLSAAGEILVRGPGLFTGYLHDAKTEEIFNAEGYYRTGDYGYIDEEGFLFLGGRESEIIKTSAGRRISPLGIEARLKEIPYVDQAVAIGSGRKCLAALLTIDWKILKNCLPELRNEDGAISQPALDDTARKIIADQIRTQVLKLAPHEQPFGFLILRSGFSIAGGELTSNLKLKRPTIAQKYHYVIDQLYAELDRSTESLFRTWFLTTADLRMAEMAELPVLGRLKIGIGERLWVVAKISGKVTAAIVRRRVMALFGDPEQHLRQQQRRIAKILKNDFGPLKGPLVKVGQMVSFVVKDLPPEIQETFSSFQDTTAPIHAEFVKKLITKELGRPMKELFTEWSDVPVSAATISQLHVARLKDGRQVIVKVKYPNIEKIVQADLLALRVLVPLLAPLMEVANLKDLHRELKEMILAECDFLNEAKNQETFSQMFADNPAVIVPKILWDYTSHGVLTMEYVDGKKFREFLTTASQAEKNRAGEIIFTLICISINRFSFFNADPHPGNYLFVDDKVCFLDFGFTKRWPESFLILWKQQSLAGYASDPVRFAQINRQLGFGSSDPKFDHRALLELYRNTLYRPWIEDKPFRFTKDFAKKQVKAIAFNEQHGCPMKFPPEYVAISRLFWGVWALMADLEAEANWHNIVVPLLNEEVCLPDDPNLHAPRLASFLPPIALLLGSMFIA